MLKPPRAAPNSSPPRLSRPVLPPNLQNRMRPVVTTPAATPQATACSQAGKVCTNCQSCAGCSAKAATKANA
jgi:hypothetical protein